MDNFKVGLHKMVGLDEWFDPRNLDQVQQFVSYLANGDHWPTEHGKPGGIEIHSLQRNRFFEQLALLKIAELVEEGKVTI